MLYKFIISLVLCYASCAFALTPSAPPMGYDAQPPSYEEVTTYIHTLSPGQSVIFDFEDLFVLLDLGYRAVKFEVNSTQLQYQTNHSGCSIRKDGTRYSVLLNDEIAEVEYSYDAALQRLKTLKDIGVCQF